VRTGEWKQAPLRRTGGVALLQTRIWSQTLVADFEKRITPTRPSADSIGRPCDQRVLDRETLRFGIATAQIRVDAHLLGQLSVWYGPFGRRRREAIRDNVLTPCLEDSNQGAAKTGRVEHHELLNEDKIDEIFCATAPLTLAVGSCVRMDLLRDVLFERQDRHFGRSDVGEGQKVRSANRFRLPIQGV
jgi:hypothetical protein